MTRNGLGILRALTQAHHEAVETFGPSAEWDRDLVTKWIARRVQAITGPAPVEPPNYVDGEERQR